MKAIILISSIFYILGLKISNKFELIKKASPVEKIITVETPEKKSVSAIKLNEETQPVLSTDSLKVIEKKENGFDESKHF